MKTRNNRFRSNGNVVSQWDLGHDHRIQTFVFIGSMEKMIQENIKRSKTGSRRNLFVPDEEGKRTSHFIEGINETEAR